MDRRNNHDPNMARASPDPDRPRRLAGFRRPPARTRTVTLILEAGLRVRLNTPDNPYLHGHPGVVKELTPYGAVVATEAAATGQYRAFPHELDPIDFDPPTAHAVTHSGNQAQAMVAAVEQSNPPEVVEYTSAKTSPDGVTKEAPAPSAVREQAHRRAMVATRAAAARKAKETDVMSPTGNACADCGNFRMVRSGACEVCLDCGASGGCS
jgi:hypothetical protein